MTMDNSAVRPESPMNSGDTYNSLNLWVRSIRAGTIPPTPDSASDTHQDD